MQQRIERTPAHLHVEFDQPRRALSSAIYNGGLVYATHVVNLKVEKNSDAPDQVFEPPDTTLATYCRSRGWRGVAVGLMTAASMNSGRKVRRVERGVEVTALVTAGLSNARRAGDRAEWRRFSEPEPTLGTINIIILTSARLTDAAMVETMLVLTEAKAAVLQECGAKSRASPTVATGTGTDAAVVVSGWGPPEVRFCGKHVLFGEMVASVTMEALQASLAGGSSL